MKKLNLWPALLIGLTLILAACGGQSDTGTDVPSFTDEPIGTEAGMPPMDGTDTGEITTPAVTEAMATATVAATEPVSPTESVATVSPTQPTGGEVIPPTGAVDPGRVSNLLDFDVCNQEGQIGAVDDLILDLDARKITYVVVEADENNPLSKDLKLVPWEAFTLVAADVTTGTQTTIVDGPENCFILNVDEAQFEGVPEFNFDNFPALGTDAGDWSADYDAYWQETISASVTGTVTDTQVTTTSTGFAGVARATELLDLELGAGDTMVSAEVDDILVDYQTGEVLYFVVSFDPGTGEAKLFALPVGVLGWNAENRVITVTVDPNVIIQAPNFAVDAYPVTTIEDWDADLRAYWDTHFP